MSAVYAFTAVVESDTIDYPDGGHDTYTYGRVYLAGQVVWQAEMAYDTPPEDVMEQFAAVLRGRLGGES